MNHMQRLRCIHAICLIMVRPAQSVDDVCYEERVV